jgi:hypothetical protein
MPTTHESEKLKDHAAKPAPDSVTPEEHEAQIHRRKDELLDHGVEETFPASDPVAVKHIT